MFYMEVKTGKPPEKRWEKVRPTGGLPYKYETAEEALYVLKICYPNTVYGDDVRVCDEDGIVVPIKEIGFPRDPWRKYTRKPDEE